MKIVWTAEMIAMLESGDRKITYADLAMEMSKKFGVEFTKNSLIGKARRLGQPVRVIRKKRKKPVASPILPPIPRVKKDEPVTLFQLGRRMCRYPFAAPADRPPYMFCGQPTKEDCSWCDKHRDVVFTKQRVIYDNAKTARR